MLVKALSYFELISVAKDTDFRNESSSVFFDILIGCKARGGGLSSSLALIQLVRAPPSGFIAHCNNT